MILTNLPVSTSGFLYIYVSNTTPNVAVFFDNLQVTHTRGPLLEEEHYYPFGLSMAGISDKAVKWGYAENKYRFQKQELQNKEFSDGSGLEEYEFKYRFDDPQIGRFGSIDPLAAKYEYNSPYAFSEDHVTGHIELEGLEKFPINEDYSFPGDPLSTIVRSAKDLQAVESQRAASRAVTGATTSTSPASTIGNVSNDGSQPVVGATSTTKVTNETTSGSLIGLGTTTITNTTAVQRVPKARLALLTSSISRQVRVSSPRELVDLSGLLRLVTVLMGVLVLVLQEKMKSPEQMYMLLLVWAL
jgi:RHS repeat-associated protein